MEPTNPNFHYTQNAYPTTPAAPVISVKDWMLTIFLLAIPVVNIIMLFVWAFGDGANPSKSNYAKAALLWAAIGLGIYLIFFVLIFGLIFSNAQM